ncbi:phosphoribosylformylglycinamidine synthase subunit PurQ [Candidatus Margulisiibacteriota bacterium]
MRFGVVVFPGSNCDYDCYNVIHRVLKQPVEFIWHADHELNDFDCIILPGGFSYGDYLRAGAIAHVANIMPKIKEFAENGRGLVLGICNGFQILTEAGLLPGALQQNKDVKFICKYVDLKCVNNKTRFTKKFKNDQAVRIPIAHGEGNYTADTQTLNDLVKNQQIIFKYCDEKGRVTDESNPNGAMLNIAGICNKKRNVLGMMPHPERCSEALLGSQDGKSIFESILL